MALPFHSCVNLWSFNILLYNISYSMHCHADTYSNKIIYRCRCSIMELSKLLLEEMDGNLLGELIFHFMIRNHTSILKTLLRLYTFNNLLSQHCRLNYTDITTCSLDGIIVNNYINWVKRNSELLIIMQFYHLLIKHFIGSHHLATKTILLVNQKTWFFKNLPLLSHKNLYTVQCSFNYIYQPI